jgi:glucosamine kinase
VGRFSSDGGAKAALQLCAAVRLQPVCTVYVIGGVVMARAPEAASAGIEFLLGVDGGGSGTRVVLARRNGPVIARGAAGPSALGQGVVQAWRNIELACRAAFEEARLPVPPWERCAVGAGLSGVSNRPWHEAFLAANIGFARLEAETDSFVMLLGAHGGKPGAILAAGTGSVAEALRPDGSRSIVGGWGFPAGDEGSGAWLALQAVRHAQSALDGRAKAGPLARRVWARCGGERESLQHWCERAGQFAYAQLAPAVFECEATDAIAASLLLQATAALEALALAVDPRGRLPLAVCGSIGVRLAPRLAPVVRSRIVPAAQGAAAGALMVIRQAVNADMEELV